MGRVGFACWWAGCSSPPSLVHLLQGTWGQLGCSCEHQEGQLVQLLLETPWPASSRKLAAWHFAEPGVTPLGVSAGERRRLEAADGTLIPSAQRLVWATKQPLGNAALGALFA